MSWEYYIYRNVIVAPLINGSSAYRELAYTALFAHLVHMCANTQFQLQNPLLYFIVGRLL